MAALTSASFFLICFVVCSSEDQEKITADLGENATLPCKVPNNNTITAVQWNKPGLESEYVLLYRDGYLDPDNQHPSYQNRVDLQDKELKDGNASLILKNVTMEDTGIYECRVFEKGNNEPISIITYLEVLPPAQKIITAELGQDVILPCKAPNNNNIAVEWIRPEMEPEYVLLYRYGHFDPENQHPSYQNRVDLQDKEMKDGDVSLILKNLMKSDTGTYKCRVFEKGKKEPISIINLEVRLSGEKFEGGKGGGDNVGIIGGSVVGVILLLAVLVSVGFLIYRRSMAQNQHVSVPLDERPVS